jgi:hypothetical protein
MPREVVVTDGYKQFLTVPGDGAPAEDLPKRRV